MSDSPPAAPPPPDPVATANAQAAANKEAVTETAKVNQINQVTPYGNLTYTGDVGAPDRTATQTLSPVEQQKLDLTNQAALKYGTTANQQLDAVSSKLAQPLDFSSLGAAPTADANARNSALASILSRNQPAQDRDLASLQTRLANSGVQVGSDAYTKEMDNYNRGVNDFRLGADTQSGNEEAQQYGLASTARNSAANEMIQQRQQPLNELAAMLTGNQVQNPSFVNPTNYNVAPGDVAGATYANYQGAQNAQQVGAQAAISNNQGMTSLLGTAAMAAAFF